MEGKPGPQTDLSAVGGMGQGTESMCLGLF